MQNYFDATKPPFFTADFHYFRLAREKWELMLTRLAQMGVNIITVTVPWGFHQVDRGTVDLNGASHARRDVLGLVKLCAALNFFCLLKPGPYCNHAGILGNGLPNWLAPDDQNFNADLLIGTQRWYQALSNALINYQWPGGPIIALHIEPESDPNQQPTYSKHLTQVQWPIWLRKRYQGIDALNTAYGTSYRTVSEISFPQKWSEDPSSPEQDARTFLEEIQADTHSNHNQILVDAGWQLPIYPSTLEVHPQLPRMENYSLLDPAGPAELELENTLLNLQHPIQVDPDPADIGLGPVWANGAPIRIDGSLRRSFWDVRQYLWSQTWPNAHIEAKMLAISFETGGVVTLGRDSHLKINLVKGTKPIAYRLRLTGELLTAKNLKAARSKLSGPYLSEDKTTQIDLVLYLNNPTIPSGGFLSSYLRLLLEAQVQTLARCAILVTALGQILDPSPAGPEAGPAAAPSPTSYTLAEARRGLSEADKILRKAITSIGGLEAGFDTMLERGSSVIPETASATLVISPEIFDGRARDILIAAGAVCKTIAPDLQAAAEAVEKTLQAPQDFTVARYQQDYARVIQVVQNAREALLDTIAHLRVQIATEKLPLVAWRIHDQIQAIAESLRWGVLRG
jgi:hypothetical protein